MASSDRCGLTEALVANICHLRPSTSTVTTPTRRPGFENYREIQEKLMSNNGSKIALVTGISRGLGRSTAIAA